MAVETDESEQVTSTDDCLVVEFVLDGQVFGLDVDQVLEVQEVDQPTSVYRTPDFVLGVMNLRGDVVALIDLARFLGLNGLTDPENHKMLLVEHDGVQGGIVVEEVLGTRRIEQTELEPPPESVDGISQEWIRGIWHDEDHMSVLLDVPSIIQSERIQDL